MTRRLVGASVAALMFLSVLSAPARAGGDDLVRVPSPHSVAETMNRLAAAVERAGAKVFARINHAKGAASVGMEVPDEELLIFGNPKIGSPAIRDAPTIGLDLPLRVIAVQEAGGSVLIYRAPAAMAEAHGLPADHPAIKKMTGALAKLTAKAAAE